jgi:hypothetical protein
MQQKARILSQLKIIKKKPDKFLKKHLILKINPDIVWIVKRNTDKQENPSRQQPEQPEEASRKKTG